MAPNTHPDAVVVGAGPAGTSAAIALADAGRHVVVVDKATFPRDKTCGDGLTTGALRLLDDLGFDPATVPSWHAVSDVVLSSPSRHTVTYPLPSTGGQFAAIARRAELDAALVELARSRGVVVHEGHAVTGVTQTSDGVEVEVDGMGSVWTPWLIGADGMWSPTRRLLGQAVPDYRGEWHAYRQYVTGVSPRAGRELLIWFEPDILPGYVWSFPLADGSANVGFGIKRGGSWRIGAMGDLWDELLARPHIREAIGEHARPEGPAKAWPIPARVGEVELAFGRVLWVGDAAAATDPMTGEGIGQALATGGWAAESILAGGSAADVGRRYDAAVRTTLVPDHAMANLLVRALQHRKGARFAIWLSGLTPWTRRNFARWLFEDYPRAILATPARWHQGMLRGEGAFRA